MSEDWEWGPVVEMDKALFKAQKTIDLMQWQLMALLVAVILLAIAILTVAAVVAGGGL